MLPFVPTMKRGVWLPVLQGLTVAGTQTYATQRGKFWVVGDVFFYDCRIILTAFDSLTEGGLVVDGIPEEYEFDNEYQSPVPGSIGAVGNFTPRAGYGQVAVQAASYTGYGRKAFLGMQVLGAGQPQALINPALDTIPNDFSFGASGFFGLHEG